MVVTGITVDDIQLGHLIEVVLSGVCRVDTTDTRIEAATEDGAETGLLKTLLISPLPTVLKMSLILRLVVGGIEVVDTTCQTSIHDGKVLIRQCQVDHQLWFEVIEEHLQLLHVISIYLCRLYLHGITSLMNGIHNLITFLFSTTCYHKVGKHISILSNLECCYCCDATGANHQYSTHRLFFMIVINCLLSDFIRADS